MSAKELISTTLACLLVQFVCCAGVEEAKGEMVDVQKVFTEHEVVPDVVNAAPKELLKVSSNSKLIYLSDLPQLDCSRNLI